MGKTSSPLGIAVLALLGSPLAADFCPDGGTLYSVGDSPFTVQLCDLDGDGRPDLVTANADDDSVSVSLNNGDGTFGAPTVFATGNEPGDLACCDVDEDGDLDVITVNHITDDVRIHFNDGNALFTAPGTSYTVGEAPWGIRCLDLNGDNRPDLVTANYTGDSISVLLNNGSGTFAPHVSGRDYATDNGTFSVAVCDVDGDTDLDVVSSNLLSSNVSVFRNNGDGTLTKTGTFSVGTNVFPWGIACCDLDGDADNDVLTAGSNPLKILFNNGSGSFGNLATYTTGLSNPYKLDCCDLDGDGDKDVVVSDLGSDDLRVFLNAGNGTLGAPSSLPVGANPGSVKCGDVDNDGDTDVATCRVTGAIIFENSCAGGACGDGIVDPGEQCDDGSNNSDTTPDACRTNCTLPACGDGVVDTGEECDDGGASAICSADCTLVDCNNNGVCDPPENACSCPTDCAVPGPLMTPLGDPTGIEKARFISFSSGSAGQCTAIRVKLVSLHNVIPPYTAGASIAFTLFEGQSQYVGPPVQYVESVSSGTPFMASKLQCAPYYEDWSTITLLHVTGEAIVPSSSYSVENLAAACLGQETTAPCLSGGANVSAALPIVTGRWGDVEATFQLPDPPVSQPDFTDIGALVNKFKSAPGAPIKARAMLAGEGARGLINLTPDLGFGHISACVDGFKGLAYPYKVGKCTGAQTTACTTDTDCGADGPCILCP